MLLAFLVEGLAAPPRRTSRFRKVRAGRCRARLRAAEGIEDPTAVNGDGVHTVMHGIARPDDLALAG
ncbi:hypothetical protein PV703_12035 [Streptomyces sp. ME01-24h]|nr:hypothetical protein [Streptomyces sp. ME01-24h]